MTKLACIVLAAGMGTRMKSGIPKVLHQAGGLSLLGHVLGAAGEVGVNHVVMVTGPGMEAVRSEAHAHFPQARIVEQTERLGTAHAVSMAQPVLQDFTGITVVLYGDVPLIRPETIRSVCAAAAGEAVRMAVLGFEARDPFGYGRLVTGDSGMLEAIREELDASPAERALRLCNSGVIAIENELLWQLIPEIGNDNAKGEYYLTDLVGLCRQSGHGATVTTCDEDEVLGVNDRRQLAEVERLCQVRYRQQALLAGVTMVAPETVFLSADTRIAEDVVIEPHVILGPGVSIGRGSIVRGFSHIENTEIGEGVSVGPFARCRPGARIGDKSRIGNFVEVKNATVEEGAKVNHLAYIGDARIGAAANVGAGTIICNYDGFNKNFTDIGNGAFIGSNSALVAPLKIGEGAYVGSGSVVTRDVKADALAVARGKQVERENWASRYRKANMARSTKKSGEK